MTMGWYDEMVLEKLAEKLKLLKCIKERKNQMIETFIKTKNKGRWRASVTDDMKEQSSCVDMKNM